MENMTVEVRDRAFRPGQEDVLTRDQAALLTRARNRLLPCPRCQRPLDGEFIYYKLEDDDYYAGVRLYCICGFVEY